MLPELRLSSRRILVVAPHPDDEVFGTGGLIAAQREAGAAVTVLFLTNGGASHQNCCSIENSTVSLHRKQLALEAGLKLGLGPSDQVFLDFPDNELPRLPDRHFEEVALAVRKVIERTAPTEVFCPHPAEIWKDHVAAAEIVEYAWRRTRRCDTVLWHYLVWAPMNQPIGGLWSLPWSAARKLPIERWASAKKDALEVYLGARPVSGCPHPWVGNLPTDFLKISRAPLELFFAAEG